MGKNIEADNIVLLFDNYGLDSQNLHKSFQLAGKNYPVVIIDDNGFLPEGVMSVFEYFLGDFTTGENVPSKPRYFNQIKVPEFWEISGNNSAGKVHDLNKERARIFYAEPKHKRLVKVVDWLDDRGVVRSSDHYNKYGALYARTIFNNKGQRVNKSYFSASGKEVIMENYVTKNIILNDGDLVQIFPNRTAFVSYFMKKAGYAQHRVFFNTLSTCFFVERSMQPNGMDDVLFWQEAIHEEIPGNMRVILNGDGNRKAKIMVQKKSAYQKMLALGLTPAQITSLGYIYPFEKENTHKPEALICTNSDNIAECKRIVEALPELHFNIVAITEMSSKLMSMEQYGNVTLYPGVKMKVLEGLFDKCDYYLDINHESEIVSAVQKAFLHNQLVFAFKETLHNPNYVAGEHIFTIAQAEDMIRLLKEVLADEAQMQVHLKMQHEVAGLESVETYLQI